MLRVARMSVPSVSSVLTILLLLGGAASAVADQSAEKPALETRLRRPVSLLTTGRLLLAGNRRSGTISVIEPESGTVLAEHQVAKRIADMVALDDERDILVLDDADRRLLKVSLRDGEPSTRSLGVIPPAASKLAVAGDRRQCFVSARWSHCVLSITFDQNFEQVTREESIGLPFAPRELLLVDKGRILLVADAFGGRIAVADAIRCRVLAIHEIDGHNIRGLALGADGRRLYVAHQRMPDRALADYEELHWGRMVSNGVRVLKLDDVLHSKTGRVLDGWLDEQGGIGRATGDPGGVVSGPRVVAVAFSGVGEVVVRFHGHVSRIAVQARPEAMAVRDDRLYVANRFDDSVSVIDLSLGTVTRTIPLGPARELTAVERGEKLFFDAGISHDGWISCHSCHTDGHSTGRLVDTLGDGDYGAPKRIPSLLGTRDTGPWGWTGSAASLAVQVRASVTTTLHGEPLTEAQASDLVAFLESLEAPPSAYVGDPGRLRQGRALFESLGCVDCHTPPAFTSDRTYDVGLADEHHRRRFNPPSLRGVGQRDRLFHDGRAETLEDVLVRFRHQLEAPLAEEELAALLAYLRSL